MRDVDAPLFKPDQLAWHAYGWEDAWEGSVADARTCSRGKAGAGYASMVGEPLTDIGVWKRHVRIYTLRDAWLGQGCERWVDDWMRDNWVRVVWHEVTSPGALSQDVAMRDWLHRCAAFRWQQARYRRRATLNQASSAFVLKMVDRFYPGGVSAFIRDHEGRGGDA